MNNQEYEIIEQARRILQGSVNGIQYMGFEQGIATFEGFGNIRNEYINYTVDVEEAIYNEEIQIKRVNVTVENHQDDGEVDLTVNTWTWDEDMKEISFQDELVKTYKRFSSAVKRAEKIAGDMIGANIETVYL